MLPSTNTETHVLISICTPENACNVGAYFEHAIRNMNCPAKSQELSQKR